MAEQPPGWRLRVRCGGLLAAFWAGGYFSAQAHATVVFDATLPVDALLPFVRQAVWTYVAGIGWIVAPLFLLRSEQALRLASRCYALALTMATTFFYLCQASAPQLRVQAAAVQNVDWSMSALSLLHAVDGPGNLVPSLHVGLAWLAADVLSREDPRWRVPSFLIALTVSVSVLLCKQHAVLGAFGGLLLAALCRPGGPYAAFVAGPAPPGPGLQG